MTAIFEPAYLCGFASYRLHQFSTPLPSLISTPVKTSSLRISLFRNIPQICGTFIDTHIRHTYTPPPSFATWFSLTISSVILLDFSVKYVQPCQYFPLFPKHDYVLFCICISIDFDGDHYDVASSLLGFSSAPELMAQTILKKREHIAWL